MGSRRALAPPRGARHQIARKSRASPLASRLSNPPAERVQAKSARNHRRRRAAVDRARRRAPARAISRQRAPSRTCVTVCTYGTCARDARAARGVLRRAFSAGDADTDRVASRAAFSPRARAPVPPRVRVGASFSPRSSRERKSTLFENAFLVTTLQDSPNAEGLLPVKRYGTARASLRDARSRATRRAEERAKKENSKKKKRTPCLPPKTAVVVTSARGSRRLNLPMRMEISV